MDHANRRKALERFDDLQNDWAVVAALPIAAASAAFCIFDHFAPWSRVLAGFWLLVLIASIGLHGLWRLQLRLLPLTAMVLLLWSLLVFVTSPLELDLLWRTLGPLVGPDSLVPGLLTLVIVIVPAGVAMYIYGRVLDRKPIPSRRATVADD